jgi:hypothetical protein
MATPGNFGEGGEHRPGPDGHNEGANKCAGVRARPEPYAAKPEPPDHRARAQHAKDAKSTPHRETIFRSPLLICIIAIMQVRSDSSCFRRSTIAMAV